MVAIFTEFFGSLALLLGFLSRVAALGLIIDMMVAVALVHLRNGFFMNSSGKQGGEGFEYHILFMALAFPILVSGAGAWSVNRWIANRLTGRHGGLEHPSGHLRDAHAHQGNNPHPNGPSQCKRLGVRNRLARGPKLSRCC